MTTDAPIFQMDSSGRISVMSDGVARTADAPGETCCCGTPGCYWRRLTHSPLTVGDATVGYRALYTKPAATGELSWCVCSDEIDITDKVMIGDLPDIFELGVPYETLSEPDSVVIKAIGETVDGRGLVEIKAIKDGVEYVGNFWRVNDYRQRDSFETCAPCMGAGTQVRVGTYDGYVTSGTIRTQIQVSGTDDKPVSESPFNYFPKIYACTDTAIRLQIYPQCQWTGDTYGTDIVFETVPVTLDFWINDEFAFREVFNSPTFQFYDFELAAGDSLFVVQTIQPNTYPPYDGRQQVAMGVPFPYAAAIFETTPEMNYPVFQPNNKSAVGDPDGLYTSRVITEAEGLATVALSVGSDTINIPVGYYSAMFQPNWDFYSGGDDGNRFVTFLARWQEVGMWSYGVYDREAPFAFVKMAYKFALHPAGGEWIDVPPVESVVCSGTPTHTRLYKMEACDPDNTMPAFIYEEDRNAIPTLDSTNLSGECYVATSTLVGVGDLPPDYHLAGTLTTVGCVGCEDENGSSSDDSSDSTASSDDSSPGSSDDSSDSTASSDSSNGSGSGASSDDSSDPGGETDCTFYGCDATGEWLTYNAGTIGHARIFYDDELGVCRFEVYEGPYSYQLGTVYPSETPGHIEISGSGNPFLCVDGTMTRIGFPTVDGDFYWFRDGEGGGSGSSSEGSGPGGCEDFAGTWCSNAGDTIVISGTDPTYTWAVTSGPNAGFSGNATRTGSTIDFGFPAETGDISGDCNTLTFAGGTETWTRGPCGGGGGGEEGSTTGGPTGNELPDDQNVQFIESDSSPQGDWIGVYGDEGHIMPAVGQSLPSYVSSATVYQPTYVWTYSTADTRALEYPDGSDRIASCWYDAALIEFTIEFNDTAWHTVALYVLDWDTARTTQNVNGVNGSNSITDDIRTVSFTGVGRWLVYRARRSAKFRIDTLGSVNLVVSGLFFGATEPGEPGLP